MAGASASAQEIRDFAEAHVAERAAAPKEIVIVEKMPLTDVQKPAKAELRRDAARRAFQALLADLGPLRVDMIADPVQGLVAVIQIAAGAADQRHGVEQQIRDKMQAFAIAYVVQWSEPT